jgi:ADP-ribose pyrophosphatase YjhB (NUDIX family)
MRSLYNFLFRALHWLTTPLSGHVLHNSLRTRVLVESGGHILLIRTRFGTQKWSLPGGGVHKNENPENAAARELLEESGVVIDSKKLKKFGEARLPKNKKWPVANIYFYKVRLNEKPAVKITRPLEIMDAKWFSIKNLPENISATVNEALTHL